MAINSKRKGNAGEREFSKKFNEIFGTSLRRSQQYCGNVDSADVIGIDGLHFEVKRVQNINLTKVMEICELDCQGESIPVVGHRKDFKPWLITVKLDDLKALIEILKLEIEHQNSEMGKNNCQ